MFRNRNFLIIALIALVNALGYGIIIPILYSYARRFGLSDFQNGLLLAVFSICQFLSAPIIGRMSDKYGRKPLLVISLLGTALSFVTMAFAPAAIFLYLARALDGLTAGNIPVAQAVISDTTEPKDRARGFGIIAASFGFGFVFGPAISTLTLGFGTVVPFLIAAAISFLAVILTWIFLPETNWHLGEVRPGKLFDFGKLLASLTDGNVGRTLLVCFIYSIAFGLLLFAYQPFLVKIIGLSVRSVPLSFTLFGVVSLISQTLIIPRATSKFGEKKSLLGSLAVLIFTFFGFFLVRNYPLFLVIFVFQSLASGFVMPLIGAILSKEVDAKSQGSIQGLSASYASLGTIFGPIVGGFLATVFIPLPFLAGSLAMVLCLVLATKISVRPQHLVSEF